MREKTICLEDKNSILENCRFVKTVLMLLVILGHCTAFWGGNWFTNNPVFKAEKMGIFSYWIGTYHIFAFVLVSGYIFAYKMSKEGYQHYAPFMLNKAKRLLVPYIFTAAIWVVPLSQYFFKWNAMELFKKYVLCINPSQLWFLWMIFGVFLIAWQLWKWLSGPILSSMLVAIGLYCIGVVVGKVLPDIYCIWTAFQYIPFFTIGIQIYMQQAKQKKLVIFKVPGALWIILDVAIFIVHTLIEDGKLFIPKLTILTGPILHIVGAMMAFVVLEHMAIKVEWKKSRIFNALSKCAMPMYLFHQQIIYFVIACLNGVVNPYINAGINFVVSVIGAFIISWIMLSFRITRFLVGEKP